MSNLRIRRLALGVAVLVPAVNSATAQRGEAASRPTWLPQYPPDLGDKMTRAEHAEAMATVEEIERILWQTPELSHPTGFEVGKQVWGGGLFQGERGVFTYYFWLWFYAPSKAATFGEGSRCLGVTVNGGGNGYFIENEVGGGIPGATVVYEGLRWDTPTADRRGGTVVFTNGGKFPWISVTREQHLRFLIEGTGGKNGELEKEFKEGLKKTAYERWMDEAAERKKNREAAIATSERAQGHAAAEELRKTLEQTERDVTQQLKAAEAEERKQNESALAHRAVDDLQAQINAMTPAERAAPAKSGANWEPVSPDDPSGRRILTQDPEFWRVRRSRVEVHSLTLGFIPTQMCEDSHVHAALEKAYNGGINWAALKRLVDRP